MLAMRGIPRRAALVAALFIAAAPGSPLRGQTLPQGLPGRYTLADVEGHALPYAPTEPGRPANAPALEVLASTLVVQPDGHFAMAMAYRVRQGDREQIFTNLFLGTIEKGASGLVMHWEGAGQTPATLEAERLAFSNEGQAYAYRRLSPPRPAGS